MERTELFAYLQSQRLGVLGTLSALSAPQAALVGYAVSPALEILFDTVRTSRKYPNMMANPRVSFTIGGADERTAQYEGIAEELIGDALARLQPIYFASWPECVAHQQWHDITWFAIHPRWIRLTDYTASIVQEWTF